jgi:hypothetical protein
MKYSCDHCSYETDKKSNYIRHINRKFRCYDAEPSVTLETPNVTPGVTLEAPNVTPSVTLEPPNVTPSVNLEPPNVTPVIIHNQFPSDKKHQCEICLKIFKHRNGKYKHKRNVLCYPPPPPPPENESPDNLLIVKESEIIVPTMNNSQNNSQNTTNSNNNNSTVNNNIIQYNAFGDEGIEQLGKFLSGRKDDAKIIEHMRQLGKKKIYGIRDIQNDIFFNPDHPEGFSIIKPEKYGSSVRVRNSEGEFEYREFEDVRDPLLNYMEKYIEIYNKTRNKYNVKFRDPKEHRILQNFFKIMNDNLEIYLGEDLKEDLNIQNNIGEEDKYKQFDKVSLDNIHVQTRKFYTCKKGEFVRKE